MNEFDDLEKIISALLVSSLFELPTAIDFADRLLEQLKNVEIKATLLGLAEHPGLLDLPLEEQLTFMNGASAGVTTLVVQIAHLIDLLDDGTRREQVILLLDEMFGGVTVDTEDS